MASVQLLELEVFLAPFCSAPVHMQHSLGLTVHSLCSYLSPSECEKSVADVAPNQQTSTCPFTPAVGCIPPSLFMGQERRYNYKIGGQNLDLPNQHRNHLQGYRVKPASLHKKQRVLLSSFHYRLAIAAFPS